jgi:hypothetical protein
MNRSKSFLFPSDQPSYSTGPDRTLASEIPLCSNCKFGLPPNGIVFHNMLPNRMPPRSQSQLPKEKSPSVFFRSLPPPLQLLLSGTLCVTSHPTPQPHEWKGFVFSAALQSSSLRLVYIITTQFLRSSFCFFFLTKGPLSLLFLPPPCRFMCCCVACADGVYGLVWVQTV